VQTAGITLLLAWIASVVTLALSPTDSGQRGFGHGAVDAVCWLDLSWAAVAIPTFGIRRHSVRRGFRWAFGANMSITLLIVLESIVRS